MTDTLDPTGPDVTQPVDPSPRLTDADSSLRSRKKQRTRLELMEAAADLFAANGFDETTTSDIAARADVSQRTLFRHFATKEAVLYGDMDDARLELREALRARPVDEPALTAVIAALLALGDNHRANRERRLMQARLAARYPSVSAHSRSVVQAEVERELIVAVADRLGVDPMADPRPEIIAGAAMSANRIAIRQWTASDGTADFMELLEAALRAIPSIADLA